jgi:hypothetical protein
VDTEYHVKLAVDDGWDLVVAGGGPAGATAALAAARRGLRTIVVEAGTRLGGMGTAGMVSSFAPMSDGRRCVAGGIAEEVMEILHERGATGPHVTPEFWRAAVQRWVPFRPEELAFLWDELLEKAGVTVRFGSRVVDVEQSGERGRLAGAIVADVEGLHCVRGAYFLDATGDAALCTFAGFPAWRAGTDTPNIMPPTLCGLFADVQWEQMELSPSGTQPLRQQERLESAIEQGRFSRNDRHLPGLYRVGHQAGMMNAGHLFSTDAVDRESLSRAYTLGRKLIREYLDFYRRDIPGCEEMQLVTTAPTLGVRESRRVEGEYVLSYDDFAARRRFEDGVGLCSGSVDIHVYDDSDEEYQRYLEEFSKRDRLGMGESFGIPYRSLLPKGSRNVWVAGRCISSDVKVQGALRIQPVAAVMGQAVGAAASLALKGRTTVDRVDTDTLRAQLRDEGAVLE